MQEVVSSSKDWLDVLVQVLIVVIPIVVAWFIRTYVRGTVAEKNVAAIVWLANAAIDYVENLDVRGELDLPPEVEKGSYKLKRAAEWLKSELQRAGIKMTDKEAQQWIASEFQKRVGDVRMIGTIAQLTRVAVDLIQGLEQSELIQLSPDVDRITYLTELGADWVIAELAKRGANISREEALTWVQAEFLRRLRAPANEISVSDPLSDLAKRAVAFTEKLKANGQLAPQPGTSPEQFETDVAVAWSVTEAVKEGLNATKTQIAEAVAIALRQRGGGSA